MILIGVKELLRCIGCCMLQIVIDAGGGGNFDIRIGHFLIYIQFNLIL